MKKNTRLFLCTIVFLNLFSFAAKAQSGYITTVAGNGSSAGFVYGDGGPATDAVLHLPSGVWVNGAGEIFIADLYHNLIRKVNTSGIISTVAGSGGAGWAGDGGPAIGAQLNSCTDVTGDGFGNLYIVDEFNDEIRKVDTGGIIKTIGGNRTAGYTADGVPATGSELNYPYGFTIDGAGNLFIADAANARVRKITPAGTITTVAGNGSSTESGIGGPATAAGIDLPGSVAVDRNGNLFFTNYEDNVIFKVNTHDTISIFAGILNDTGYTGDGGAATNAKLHWPMGIAVDGSNNVFFSDLNNNVIRKIDTAGIITTVAGTGYGDTGIYMGGYTGDGGPATAAELFNPSGICFDGHGNLYIADALNDVIRKVSAVGTPLPLAVPEQAAVVNTIELVPNPNRGSFTINGTQHSNDVNVSVEIMDIMGQRVYRSTAEVQNGSFNIRLTLPDNIANGIYLLHISGQSESNILRFVVDK